MNTLTRQINNLELHFSQERTDMIDEPSECAGTYEVIENETLRSSNFNSLVVSGSLFSLTTFTSVSFESCTFFATQIENCTFVNCNFDNCIFEFSNLAHSKFNHCNFTNTKWDMATLRKSTFSFCNLDTSTHHYTSKGHNNIFNCKYPEELSWEQVLESPLPPIPSLKETESSEEVTQELPVSRIVDALTKVLKAA